jgi:hypothetical protein
VKFKNGYFFFVSDVSTEGATDGCGRRRRTAERRS